jgi:uncharacterized membrane protein (UPF0127 family)
MQVENRTRCAVLANNVEVADNLITRFLGLMGRRALPEGQGLVIRPCSGVHTMFMRFPIDVLYVDRENRIVWIDAIMCPWRLGRIVRRSHYVVELPAGTAARTGTEVGDEIVLQ